MADAGAVPAPVNAAQPGVVSTAVRAKVKCTCGNVLANLFVIYRAALGDDATALQLAEVLREAGTNGASAFDQLFHLAKVKTDGTLGPARDGAESPDAYPLVPNGVYECLFVHHPSLALATSIQSSLNLGQKTYSPRVKLVDPDDGVPGGFRLLVSCGSDLLHGADKSDTKRPHAPARYKYALFRDMPTAECQATKDQVIKLQEDLGALRYIVGGYDPALPNGVLLPYAAPKLTAAQREKLVEEIPEEAEEPLQGEFSAQTMNAVYAFQLDASAKENERTPDADGLAELVGGSPSNPWDYVSRVDADPFLCGSDAQATGKERRYLTARPAFCDGVVDDSTAKAIEEALKNHWIRNGPVLVPLPKEYALHPEPMWARYDAALRVDAWHQLALAFGTTGIKAGICAYRSIYNSVTTKTQGKASMSNHKTGHAVDLFNFNGTMMDEKAMLAPGRPFPFVMVESTAEERAARQRESGKGACSSGWTMYLPCVHPIDAQPGRSMDDVKKALEEARVALVAKLKELEDRKTQGHENPFLHAAAVKLGKLAGKQDALTFWSTYLRAEVRPWVYAQDESGGAALGPTRSPNPAKNKSWLNLYALAHEVDLTEIPNSGEWKCHEKDVPISGANTTEVLKRVKKALELYSDGSVWLQSSPAEPVKLADFDCAGLESFRDAARQIQKGAAKKKGTVRAAGFALEWTPGGDKKDNESILADVKKAIEDRALVRLTQTPAPAEGTPSSWTSGKAAAESLKKALLEPRVIEHTDASKKTKKQAPTKFVIEVAIAEETQIALSPTEVLIVPERKEDGKYRSLEWWHIQVPRMTLWTSEMRKVGWRREALGDRPIDALHGRTGVGFPLGEKGKKS